MGLNTDHPGGHGFFFQEPILQSPKSPWRTWWSGDSESPRVSKKGGAELSHFRVVKRGALRGPSGGPLKGLQMETLELGAAAWWITWSLAELLEFYIYICSIITSLIYIYIYIYIYYMYIRQYIHWVYSTVLVSFLDSKLPLDDLDVSMEPATAWRGGTSVTSTARDSTIRTVMSNAYFRRGIYFNIFQICSEHPGVQTRDFGWFWWHFHICNYFPLLYVYAVCICILYIICIILNTVDLIVFWHLLTTNQRQKLIQQDFMRLEEKRANGSYSSSPRYAWDK